MSGIEAYLDVLDLIDEYFEEVDCAITKDILIDMSIVIKEKIEYEIGEEAFKKLAKEKGWWEGWRQ